MLTSSYGCHTTHLKSRVCCIRSWRRGEVRTVKGVRSLVLMRGRDTYPPISKLSYHDYNSQATSQSTSTPRIYTLSMAKVGGNSTVGFAFASVPLPV